MERGDSRHFAFISGQIVMVPCHATVLKIYALSYKSEASQVLWLCLYIVSKSHGLFFLFVFLFSPEALLNSFKSYFWKYRLTSCCQNKLSHLVSYLGIGPIRSSISIGFRYQRNSRIGNFRSNLQRFPIHEPCLCFNVVCWNDSTSDSLLAAPLAGCKMWNGFPDRRHVSMRRRAMRHASFQEILSTVCSQVAGEHWAALWLTNFSSHHVRCVEIFYTRNTAKQDSNVQCLQSRCTERRKLSCDLQFNELNQTFEKAPN